MKIFIVRDDALVGIDGIFRKIDVSDLDVAIHDVSFNTNSQKGSVKYNDTQGWKNILLSDFASYQVYVDRWTAAAPVSLPIVPSTAKVAAQTALVSVQALPSVQAELKTLLAAIVNAL